MPLDSFASAAELEALGPDVLKAELILLGLKCGGTVGERAARLWATRGVDDLTTLPPAMFAKRRPPGVEADEEAKAKAKRKRQRAEGEEGEEDARRPQRGPLLPGQSLAQGQTRLPASGRSGPPRGGRRGDAERGAGQFRPLDPVARRQLKNAAGECAPRPEGGHRGDGMSKRESEVISFARNLRPGDTTPW